MDLSNLGNLEKLKVVELRNELQKRGLDTKGVKAVLIDRLRTYLSSVHLSGSITTAGPTPVGSAGVGAGPVVGTPIGTPCRRSRRTRSMTRSPSPPPAKKLAEPSLQTLTEEGLQTCPQVIQANATTIPNEQTITNVNFTTIDASIDLTTIDSSPEADQSSPLADTTQQIAPNAQLFQKFVADNTKQFEDNQCMETAYKISEVSDLPDSALITKDDLVDVIEHDQVALQAPEEILQTPTVTELEEDRANENPANYEESPLEKERFLEKDEKAKGQILMPVPGDDMEIQKEVQCKEPETIQIEMSSVVEDKVLSDSCHTIEKSVLESIPEVAQTALTGEQLQQDEAISLVADATLTVIRDVKNTESVADDLSTKEYHLQDNTNDEKTAEHMEAVIKCSEESEVAAVSNVEQSNATDVHQENIQQIEQEIDHIENSLKLEKPESELKQNSVKKEEGLMEAEMECSVKSVASEQSSSRGRSRSPRKRDIVDAESNAPEDEPSIEDYQYGLSWFDSDLHLRIDPVTFTSARPINQDIYALVWSGARANYGVREGKVCFEVRLSDWNYLTSSHEFYDEPHVLGFRVGFSLASTSLLLGEDNNSFAYCENGRKVNNNEFIAYGEPYDVEDVIGCYLDLDSTPCTIRYTLNGLDLGVAFEFEHSILAGDDNALFPHVLTKGYEYELNFADNENLFVNAERNVSKKRNPLKKNSPSKEIESKPSDTDKIDKPEKPTTDDKNGIAEQQASASNAPDVPLEEVASELQEQAADSEVKKVAKPPTEIETQMEMKTETAEMEIQLAKILPAATTHTETTDLSDISDNKETPTQADKFKATSDTDQKNDDNSSVVEEENTKSIATTNPMTVKGCKNCKAANKHVEINFDDECEDCCPKPRKYISLLSDYELIALIPEDKYIAGPQRPQSRKECEVILMVGLPNSGKTTWVMNHVKENPHKRYNIIGADALIAKMTVDGAPRDSVHKGRFERVYELAYNILTSLEDIAVKRRRNFILDQTNVYASAQRRKMKGFSDMKRIAVVCLPNQEELKRRLASRKEKGYVHTLKGSTLNSIQASFTLPSLEFGWFDEIIYTDLSGNEAKDEVKRLNEIGKKALDANNPNRDKVQRTRDYYRNDNRRRYDERRHYDQRSDHRWNRGVNYHQYSGNMMSNRWGVAGGGHYSGMNSAYRDERNRGYDHRPPGRFGGMNAGPMVPPNWMSNNHNRHGRFDDRQNRYNNDANLGGSHNRYDNYSGGGNMGSGSRNYRTNIDYRENRDQRNNSNSSNSRSSNNSSRRDSFHRTSGSINNQRDFRHGHRDTREDSRGGRGTVVPHTNTNKYNAHSNVSNDISAYNSYNKSMMGHNSSGNWKIFDQHSNQHNFVSTQPASSMTSWQQCPQQNQQDQQYWDYGSQGYDQHDQQQQHQQDQQHWQNVDSNQQEQWMAWWQQQQGGNDICTAPTDSNQYWVQYGYNNGDPSNICNATATTAETVGEGTSSCVPNGMS